MKIYENPPTLVQKLLPVIFNLKLLSCSDVLKHKYQNSLWPTFYTILLVHSSCFRHTYVKKTLSKIKFTKNVYIPKLIKEHLESLLILLVPHPHWRRVIIKTHLTLSTASLMFQCCFVGSLSYVLPSCRLLSFA